ncbi:mechanosensitive ion channel protein MscL [Dolosigranulum pigrum]|jgi:large conductance mechanosensitive channel protein|uniref:Large-conductance mechanosensitive channel n=2 Tax=Dolosigranulum pigrum TaxID=29394 RepID=H3ND24_9LACT|nr:large conductance mechanosensitive channel protein MscL [Dolosigranulum pigrum]EHR34617.1 large conductance mechanosensitive channel protein [Dolosigranulum pigrum ATCC 51524]OOL81661.1 mechanosensitive ion channel protein MscL [Dolosigranulum pigrum]QDO90626.1 large conductance mechanosensitive channel protein MscL [Dolosigranulum pigrum]QTJ32132.1 large conductance mechanosensitive channel protein MscL [Dolosigranulum pigrum]QTJ33878.1 large conductance mechanosensitive channel protein Ms
MLQEFKDFIMKGNVLDLAIGVVMGSAFTAIVNALVDHIIGPIIAAIGGGEDISYITIPIGPAELGVGEFAQAIIDFLIIAVILFLIMKGVNKLKAPFMSDEEPEEPKAPTSEELLADIKELLQQQTYPQNEAEVLKDIEKDIHTHDK